MIRLLKGLGVILPLLIGVAYRTLLERKVRGGIQGRRGPNVIGVYGLLSPLADGLKLLLKEVVRPKIVNKKRYRRGPRITFFLARIGWGVIPRIEGGVYSDIKRGVIYRLSISTLGAYGVRLGGWGSNSKYAFLGGIRSSSQILSYELSRGFLVIGVILCTGSSNITEIVLGQEKVWYIRPRRPSFIIFYRSVLAETNRHPFDLPEAEAELVSGYHVEYSGRRFAMYYRGEYSNMIRISSRTTVLFLGGWGGSSYRRRGLGVYVRKVVRIRLGFIWARGAYPRYRYDQLIRLGWKVILPIGIGMRRLTNGRRLGINKGV